MLEYAHYCWASIVLACDPACLCDLPPPLSSPHSGPELATRQALEFLTPATTAWGGAGGQGDIIIELLRGNFLKFTFDFLSSPCACYIMPSLGKYSVGVLVEISF